MNDFLITEHNLETGEILTREMTKKEIDDLLKQQKLEQEIDLANAKAEAEKAAKRKSALAKLAALGLTEDEIAAL